MKKNKQKKEAAVYPLSEYKVKEMLKNDMAGIHLSNLITPEVCAWYNDNHKNSARRFRAVVVKKILCLEDVEYGGAELIINFDVCVHNKYGKVITVPHCGAWTLWMDGGFIEARVKFCNDGNTYSIFEGSIPLD